MDLNLANKVDVVTGASKGIGLAIVRGLIEEGARVVVGASKTSSRASAASRRAASRRQPRSPTGGLIKTL